MLALACQAELARGAVGVGGAGVLDPIAAVRLAQPVLALEVEAAVGVDPALGSDGVVAARAVISTHAVVTTCAVVAARAVVAAVELADGVVALLTREAVRVDRAGEAAAFDRLRLVPVIECSAAAGDSSASTAPPGSSQPGL